MKQFKAIRRAGVPLSAVETADPAATIQSCLKQLNGQGASVSCIQWDILNGLTGLNPKGADLAQELSPNGPIDTGNPAEALLKLAGPGVGEDCICFWHNAPRFLSNEAVMQGVWNLRDLWKPKRCHLVLLGSVFLLPDELRQDVVVLREPMPGDDELAETVASIMKDAKLEPVQAKDMPPILDTLRGLSAFAAEQVLAMSLSKAGIDQNDLWERKRMMIEQTPGLSVWRGGGSFQDIGGCNNVKTFLGSVMAGNGAPKAIVFIDEIEKALAGAGSDSTGVSQDYLGTLLAWMQDKEAAGCIFVGPPGAAKSAVAKAAGGDANVPTIAMDLGGMKGSLVGQSEQRLRGALAVIEAIAQGSVLFLATCNSLAILPPELKRRFTLGTFFFDLPTAAERATIWQLYLKKYSLTDTESGVNAEGWTGAEIKQCCQIAYRLRCTVVEAAAFVVPVAKSASDKIDQLRREASGRFISASYSGTYQHTKQTEKASRAITLSN